MELDSDKGKISIIAVDKGHSPQRVQRSASTLPRLRQRRLGVVRVAQLPLLAVLHLEGDLPQVKRRKVLLRNFGVQQAVGQS